MAKNTVDQIQSFWTRFHGGKYILALFQEQEHICPYWHLRPLVFTLYHSLFTYIDEWCHQWWNRGVTACFMRESFFLCLKNTFPSSLNTRPNSILFLSLLSVSFLTSNSKMTLLWNKVLPLGFITFFKPLVALFFHE